MSLYCVETGKVEVILIQAHFHGISLEISGHLGQCQTRKILHNLSTILSVVTWRIAHCNVIHPLVAPSLTASMPN